MATSKTKRDEEFTFVSPVVKYLLFLFNMLFWVSAAHFYLHYYIILYYKI